jgi:hypothetical protein
MMTMLAPGGAAWAKPSVVARVKAAGPEGLVLSQQLVWGSGMEARMLWLEMA